MFKNNLHKLRVAQGLNQTSMASSVGVSQTVISMYERGLCMPSLRVLINLADALGVTVSELLGEAPIEGAGKLPASAETGLAQSGQAEEIAKNPPDNARKPGRFDHIDFAAAAAKAREDKARQEAWLKEHPAPDDLSPDEIVWISDDDDDWAKEDYDD